MTDRNGKPIVEGGDYVAVGECVRNVDGLVALSAGRELFTVPEEKVALASDLDAKANSVHQFSVTETSGGFTVLVIDGMVVASGVGFAADRAMVAEGASVAIQRAAAAGTPGTLRLHQRKVGRTVFTEVATMSIKTDHP